MLFMYSGTGINVTTIFIHYCSVVYFHLETIKSLNALANIKISFLTENEPFYHLEFLSWELALPQRLFTHERTTLLINNWFFCLCSLCRLTSHRLQRSLCSKPNSGGIEKQLPKEWFCPEIPRWFVPAVVAWILKLPRASRLEKIDVH